MNYLNKIDNELLTTDLAKAIQLVKKDLRTQIFFSFREVLQKQGFSETWLEANGRMLNRYVSAFLRTEEERIDVLLMKLASKDVTMKREIATNDELNNALEEIKKRYFTVFKGKHNRYFDTLLQVRGISWEMADTLYLQLEGTKETDFPRMQAYLTHGVFAEKAQAHQFWLTEAEIKQTLVADLTAQERKLKTIPNKTIQRLLTDKKRVKEVFSHQEEVAEERTFASTETYTQLTRLFRKLKKMQTTSEQQFDRLLRDKEEIGRIMRETEVMQGFPFSDDQKEAIFSFWENKVFILTGEAGSGKTTTVRALIDCIRQKQSEVCLYGASFTARASFNLAQLAGLKDGEWGTLHRLRAVNDFVLYKGVESKLAPAYEAIDFLIVEEFSMVSLNLLVSIIPRLRDDARILFIGDIDQLPPIEIGFAQELCASEIFARTRLGEIQRQDKESRLYAFIGEVRAGVINQQALFQPTSDFTFISKKDTGSMVTEAVKRYLEAIHQTNEVAQQQQAIRVIATTNKVVQDMNQKIQAELLDNAFFMDKSKYVSASGKIKFYVGDRIMINTNISGTLIANGMTGRIVDYELVDHAENSLVDNVQFQTDGRIPITLVKHLVIAFDDLPDLQRLNTYDLLSKLDLGYASTVHKMQGLTAKQVIMVLNYSPYMNNRQLVYTGVSRASEHLTLISNPSTLKQAVQKNIYENARQLYKDL